MASDIRTSALSEPVDVAEYLFRRIYEVGIRDVHGVPGDYNLVCIEWRRGFPACIQAPDTWPLLGRAGLYPQGRSPMGW